MNSYHATLIHTKQTYMLTTLHTVLRNKYTFLPHYTQSYETSIHSYHVTHSRKKQVYILTTLHSITRNKYTFLPRYTQS